MIQLTNERLLSRLSGNYKGNKMTAATTKYLSDYRKPTFLIETVNLTFELEPQATRVTAVSQLIRHGDSGEPLVLDGDDLVIDSIAINSQALLPDQYSISNNQLTIVAVPDQFELTIVTTINPLNNTKLEGLYVSGDAFCSQCEAEGFRRITYYLDRPDVMAIFTTKIIANKDQYPYLLSNGNSIESGTLENNRHYKVWHDPFKKPAYLFALVAGDFDLLEGTFTTRSGRNVALEFFVDKGNRQKAQHALASLQRAMKWDEERFDLEYDLDIYMVVAVDFFNMGAMENKGLNVFNSKYVLADVESATDADFDGIESVIGHEYFHNWTGNRITCRDWFQLSLKEGLTVFRDQEFSSDLGSRAVNRISAVKVMRSHQFAEDAGPMAHPIRPEAVIEMNNFYTVTVYNKGAEVIRMIHTLLGEEGFQRGMASYIEQFDGMAVTCDDFISAMEHGAEVDLTQFRLWYSQAGTPVISVSESYDKANARYSVTLTQSLATGKVLACPLHIPVSIELIANDGQLFELAPNTSHKILELTQSEQTFVFDNISSKPLACLLGDFSAPVKLSFDYDDQQLAHLIRYSSSDVARWDSAQKYLTKSIIQNSNLYSAGAQMSVDPLLVASFNQVLSNEQIDPALVALMLELPSVMELFELVDSIAIDAIIAARSFVQQQLAQGLSRLLATNYDRAAAAITGQDSDISWRQLKNGCLKLMAVNASEQVEALVSQQYQQAQNMTDAISALSTANDNNLGCLVPLSQHFDQKWAANGLVMDKWFALIGANPSDDVIESIKAMFDHPTFSWNNPNRVRSLIGSFAMANPKCFHAIDGSGYQFLTDQLIKLNTINPQIASRLITPLLQWKKHDVVRGNLIKLQLNRLASLENLATDLAEKVNMSLA